jgi:hypothetical protein
MNTLKRKSSLLTDKLMHIINKYRITIILGEVDAGKTTLLNEFYEKYKDITMYKSMIALTKKDTIDNTIQFILLDALDEALYQKEEEEVFENLLDFIRQCRDMNSHVKFVISCRKTIWNDKFQEQLQKIDTQYQKLQEEIANLPESEEIFSMFSTGYDNGLEEDRSIEIYTLKSLSKDKINDYLGNRRDAFWNFVEKNHLIFVNSLNIYHILHLCDNFEQYERKGLMYFEIYDIIIRQHLQAFSDNQRNRLLDSLSIDELFKIASAVAFYNVKYKSNSSFTLQISEELKSLCSSIDISIDEQKLKILGDTTLYYLLENNSDDIQQIKSYLAAYYLKDFDESIIIEQTISRSEIVGGYENMILHLKYLKPSFLENHFKDFDRTKMKKGVYKLFIYTKPSDTKISDVWNSIVDAKLNFKEIVFYIFLNNNTYCKALFTFMREKDLFKEEPILLSSNNCFELNLLKNLYHQTIPLDDLFYLIQFIPENKFEEVFDLLEEDEWMLIFEEIDKEYLELSLDKSFINMLIRNILISFPLEEVLLKVISFSEKYEITIKGIYFKDFQSSQIEILWNLYFKEEKNIFVYFPNLLHLLKKQSGQYPINRYVDAYKKLYNKYGDSIINQSQIKWDFLLENENFKEEKEAYDEKYPSWDSCIKQEGEKEHIIISYDEFHSSKETLQSCLGTYYDTFMQKLKDEFNQVHFTRNGIKERESRFGEIDYFIEYQSDSRRYFLNIFKKFSTEEMNDFFDTKEMYNKLFCFVPRSEKCQKSFFSTSISSKMSSLNKKYKESFIENIKNDMDYWLQNLEAKWMPPLLCNLERDVKEFTLDEIEPLLDYMKSSSLFCQKWCSFHRDDKQFLLNLLEKEQRNFEFIFELMKKDIEQTALYLNKLLDMNLEKTVDKFIIYYHEEGKKQVLYDGFVASLKGYSYISGFYGMDENQILKKKVMVCLGQKNIKAFLVDGYSFYANPTRLVFWDYVEKETLEELSKNKNFTISLKAEELLKPMYDKEVRSKEIGVKHSPDKLVKILTNFRKDTPIKYTTHLWDMNFSEEYGNFEQYIAMVTKQWEEIESELKRLSPNIHRKVYDFLINTSPTMNWCSKDGDEISIGWSSLDGLEEWCDRGEDPFKFELKKSYSVENKTISTFGDVIHLFKQEIQIRNENDVLESIFIDIEESLDDEFDGIFEIETSKLKGKSFYTDVEKFKDVVNRIFSEIKKRKEFNKIVVKMREYDDVNYMDLIITQIGSSANRTKEDMEKISNGGDMAEIKRNLKNLCDWSVETSYNDKSYRLDYLGHIDNNIEIESRGFTHRLRFYR